MIRYISPWIFTTQDCNLRCPYCYVKLNDKSTMSKEVYDNINKKFIGMLENDELDMVVYRIAGGEPLLVYDNWKAFVKEFLDTVKEKGFVSLITNLTILTDDMMQFFKDYNIGFGISLDGYSYSKPYVDGNSSAKVVMDNIDKLLASGVNKNIDISTVIDKNSFDDVDKLTHWIAKRNLSWGCYLDHYFCGEIDRDIIINKMKEVIDILKEYDYDIYNKFKFNNIKVNQMYEGCTAGEKLITIDYDGKVYPCQTLIYEKAICDIDDNIVEEFKRQNVYKIGYNYSLPKECDGCAIADICGGGCKLHNKEINKNYTCDLMKEVILYMLQTIVGD